MKICYGVSEYMNDNDESVKNQEVREGNEMRLSSIQRVVDLNFSRYTAEIF